MTHRKRTPNSMFSAPIYSELETLLNTTCKDPWRPPYNQCMWTVSVSPKKRRTRCKNRLGEDNEVRISEIMDNLIHTANCPPNDELYNNVKGYLELTHCLEHNIRVVDKFHGWWVAILARESTPVRPTTLKDLRRRQMSMEDAVSESVSRGLTSDKWLPGTTDVHQPSTSTMSNESGFKSEGDTSFGWRNSPSKYSTVWDESVNGLSSSAMTPETTPETTPEKDKGKILGQTHHSSDESRPEKSTNIEQLDAEDDIITSPFAVPADRKSNHLVSPLIKKIVGHMELGFNHYKKPKGKVYALSHKSHPGLFKVGWTARSAADRITDMLCNKVGAKIIHETEEFPGARKVEDLVKASFHHRMLRINSCGYCGVDHEEWFEVDAKDMVDCIEAWKAYVKSPVYSGGCRTHRYDAFSAALIDLSPKRILRVVEESFPLDVATDQTRDSPAVQDQPGGQAIARGSLDNVSGRLLEGGSANCDDTTEVNGTTDVTGITEVTGTKRTEKPSAVEKKTDESSDVDNPKRFALQRRASTFKRIGSGLKSGLVKAVKLTIRLGKSRGKKGSAAGGTTECE